MDADEWARRGSSFGAVAAAYAEHRPTYPADAVAWCVAPTGRPVAELRVLDLGAGTGKLTALLAELGADVTAVEPDQAMLAELRRQLPSVRALQLAALRSPQTAPQTSATPQGSAPASPRRSGWLCSSRPAERAPGLPDSRPAAASGSTCPAEDRRTSKYRHCRTASRGWPRRRISPRSPSRRTREPFPDSGRCRRLLRAHVPEPGAHRRTRAP